MKRFLLLLLFCFLPPAHAAEESVAMLGAEFWFTPRHADVIATHEGVRAAVRKLIAEPDAYLVLRYPQTESGELWGQELQAWLVSLGLVSDRIELRADADLLEAVELVVVGRDVVMDEVPVQIDAPVQQGVATEPGAGMMESPEQGGVTEEPIPQADMELSEDAVSVDAAEIDVQVETELE